MKYYVEEREDGVWAIVREDGTVARYYMTKKKADDVCKIFNDEGE